LELKDGSRCQTKHSVIFCQFPAANMLPTNEQQNAKWNANHNVDVQL
jgi:hypothetical protein